MTIRPNQCSAAISISCALTLFMTSSLWAQGYLLVPGGEPDSLTYDEAPSSILRATPQLTAPMSATAALPTDELIALPDLQVGRLSAQAPPTKSLRAVVLPEPDLFANAEEIDPLLGAADSSENLVATAPPPPPPPPPLPPPPSPPPPHTPLPTPEPPVAKALDAGYIFRFAGANFDNDSSTLRPEGRDTVAALAEAMLQRPDLHVQVSGHTDSVGTTGDNELLSQLRAHAVVDALVELGIDRDRMQAVGNGESMPVDDNNTAEGRANNRRVDVVRISG